MEQKAPRVDDHCKIQILLKPIGGFSNTLFDQLFDHLTKNDSIRVSTGSARTVSAKFVKQVENEYFRFWELQAFRRIFGLICIGRRFLNKNKNSNSNSTNDDVDHIKSHEEKRSDGEEENDEGLTLNIKREIVDANELSEFKECYVASKNDMSFSLVDSRCVLLGFQNIHPSFDSPEVVPLPNQLSGKHEITMAAEEIERIAHELVRSIYFVLESKRLDTAFERAENPQCPTLPEEEKYQVGVENPKAKSFRKKCIGRLRKRVGDYALLTGLPDAALSSYQSAIDFLKTANDLLWLAAAYEGWCVASMLCKYRSRALHNDANDSATGGCSVIPRVSTISDHLNECTSTDHDLGISIGHQRYRSDEVGRKQSGVSGKPWASSSANSTELIAQSEGSSETEPEGAESSETGQATTSADNSPGQTRKFNQTNKLDEDTQKLRIFGGGIGTTLSRKNPLKQLFNFDSSKKDRLKPHNNTSLNSVGQTTPANRSASMQNLAALNTSLPNHGPSSIAPSAKILVNGIPSSFTGSSNPQPPHQSSSLVTRFEIFERFKLALENYKKFSYVVFIEYECVLRTSSVLIFHRQFIDVDLFLRDYHGKYLDDKFTTFNNKMKSQVCMAYSSIYEEIGFRRKVAFFQRLAVLFLLHVENNEVKSDDDYKLPLQTYPVIHHSLSGYGIGDHHKKSNKTSQTSGRGSPRQIPFELQVRAIHEAYICANRAGHTDIAIRHLCYIIQNYFDYTEKSFVLQMIEDLHKLVKNSTKMHELNKPIVLDDDPEYYASFQVRLAPLELTKIPALSYFQICSLPPHLHTSVIRRSSIKSNIFIYSPFQERNKMKKDEIYYVVNCLCEISVNIHNPLPIDLEVKDLRLVTDGCHFDPIPVKITLASCFCPSLSPESPKEYKLSGIPRSTGNLTFTGYSCEVFGVRNICSLSKIEPRNRPAHKYTVKVLSEQPLLEVETSMPKTPIVGEAIPNNGGIAEALVFSGQRVEKIITLYNSNTKLSIRRVVIKINQLEVSGGPKFLQLAEDSSCEENMRSELEVYDLKPHERRDVRLCIFGIDPTTSASSSIEEKPYVSGKSEGVPEKQQIGEEHKIFLKRSCSTSQLTVVSADSISMLSTTSSVVLPGGKSPKPNKKSMFLTVPGGHKRVASLPISNSLNAAAGGYESDSTRLLLEDNGGSTFGHDLIPYTGRLLNAELTFLYFSDIPSSDGEEYCRSSRLVLAITIVPAVNVSDWHVMKGEGPMTRYVVVDVTNHTNMDAELAYGDGKSLCVQSKEACRVPLLCPCCIDIKTSDFQIATQKASHMMQKHEIEQLRRKIEEHVAKHLEIRWSIPGLELDGTVPVGSFLSSVSFLKQLAIPMLSMTIQVNEGPCRGDEDITVGIGEMISLKIGFLCSFRESGSVLSGEIQLGCHQEVHSSQALVDQIENLVVCGAYKRPFRVSNNLQQSTSSDSTYTTKTSDKRTHDDDLEESCHKFEDLQQELDFSIAFLCEGLYKVQPQISNLSLRPIANDDVFIPTVSFNVITRLASSSSHHGSSSSTSTAP